MRILVAQLNPTIGDVEGNTQKILAAIEKGKESNANIVLFSELVLTGYPPEDFLLMPHFIASLDRYLARIREATQGLTAIVGTPRVNPESQGKPLFNSAAIFTDGRLVGYQDKSLLPTYDVFDERRYFEPANWLKPWNIQGKKVAITICEDLWQHSALLDTAYTKDPVLDLSYYKPDILLNLSASPYSLQKLAKRTCVCCRAATTLHCPVVLCNQVGGNDGLIFDGASLVVDRSGNIQTRLKEFEEDLILIDLGKAAEIPVLIDNSTEQLYKALVLGIRDYFHKSGFKKACLGLSGGIDSAVVACLAVDALGKENVLGVSMPSRYSSEHSRTDAKTLATCLGIAYQAIPIETTFQAYLDLLAPAFQNTSPDTTEENLQARIRGMILMALSNKFGHIVLSTGNKSELAMGYATLYGDMCGGLAVLSDVTKRQVYALARWINRDKEIIPDSTLTKAPSAELRPNQKDSDSLPEYDVIDNVVQAYVEEHLSPKKIAEKYHYSLELVQELVKKIHRNEYKRRQSAPGLRVSERVFSVGRRFPIVCKSEF